MWVDSSINYIIMKCQSSGYSQGPIVAISDYNNINPIYVWKPYSHMGEYYTISMWLMWLIYNVGLILWWSHSLYTLRIIIGGILPRQNLYCLILDLSFFRSRTSLKKFSMAFCIPGFEEKLLTNTNEGLWLYHHFDQTVGSTIIIRTGWIEWK